MSTEPADHAGAPAAELLLISLTGALRSGRTVPRDWNGLVRIACQYGRDWGARPRHFTRIRNMTVEDLALAVMAERRQRQDASQEGESLAMSEVGTGHQQLSAAIAAMTEDQVRTAFSYLFLNLLERRGPWEGVISNAVNAGIKVSPVLRSDREGIRERLLRQADRGGNRAAVALLEEFEREWARQNANQERERQ